MNSDEFVFLEDNDVHSYGFYKGHWQIGVYDILTNNYNVIIEEKYLRNNYGWISKDETAINIKNLLFHVKEKEPLGLATYYHCRLVLVT